MSSYISLRGLFAHNYACLSEQHFHIITASILIANCFVYDMRSFEEDTDRLLDWATTSALQHAPRMNHVWLGFFEQCVRLWHEVATRGALRCVTAWMLAARTLPEVQLQWPPRHAIDFIARELKQAHWNEHAAHLYEIQDAIVYFSEPRYDKYSGDDVSIHRSTCDPHTLLPELRNALTSPHPQEIVWQKRIKALLYALPKNTSDFASLYPSEMSIPRIQDNTIQYKTSRRKRRVPRKRF